MSWNNLRERISFFFNFFFVFCLFFYDLTFYFVSAEQAKLLKKKKNNNYSSTEADGVDGGCSAVQYALDHGIDAWREAEQGVLEAR